MIHVSMNTRDFRSKRQFNVSFVWYSMGGIQEVSFRGAGRNFAHVHITFNYLYNKMQYFINLEMTSF